MKVRNLRSRPIVIGAQTINPNETAIVADLPEVETLLREGAIRYEDVKLTEVSSPREELQAKKMSELREIGNQYGAKDTSKEELIEEILKKRR